MAELYNEQRVIPPHGLQFLRQKVLGQLSSSCEELYRLVIISQVLSRVHIVLGH